MATFCVISFSFDYLFQLALFGLLLSRYLFVSLPYSDTSEPYFPISYSFPFLYRSFYISLSLSLLIFFYQISIDWFSFQFNFLLYFLIKIFFRFPFFLVIVFGVYMQVWKRQTKCQCSININSRKNEKKNFTNKTKKNPNSKETNHLVLLSLVRCTVTFNFFFKTSKLPYISLSSRSRVPLPLCSHLPASYTLNRFNKQKQKQKTKKKTQTGNKTERKEYEVTKWVEMEQFWADRFLTADWIPAGYCW